MLERPSIPNDRGLRDVLKVPPKYRVHPIYLLQLSDEDDLKEHS
jgi:hypothetical protein